jgi:hypothetical protein
MIGNTDRHCGRILILGVWRQRLEEKMIARRDAQKDEAASRGGLKRPSTENEMPTQREIDQLKERIGEYNEKISRLWKTLSPVERGWVDLPDEEVAKLRRRMSECESERERPTAELAEALSRSA